MYSVELSAKAERYLERLDSVNRQRVGERLEQLAADPFDPGSSKPLHGQLAHARSSRIGSFRILFRVLQDRVLVIVMDIGPRGDIYKQ